MSKYSALSEHLAQSEGSSISLTFEEIERILDAPLPNSAKKFDAWWENEKSGSHTWAHLWRAAGWLRDTVNLREQVVTFRRSEEHVDGLLSQLRPRTKEAIYDLLQLAHISTDEWHTTNTGREIERVKANPSYCYDWSFGAPREGYALCIWHETLDVRGGQIVFTENLRAHAANLRKQTNEAIGNSERRSRTLTQAARAQAFDDALSISYERMLPVSVILTEGDRLAREAMGDGSSHVQYRALDPVKWFVHEYDDTTGAARLVRGQRPLTLSAPAIDAEEEGGGEPDKIQLRAIAIRQGQGEFRQKLLSAYGRTCAVTGCRVVDLLEAAHIRPHADEPNYYVTNGLLLRADIHTLFDLGLLAIDNRLRVRVAPALLRSEYKDYEGREIRHPAYPSEMPNPDALERRYQQFQKKIRESGSP